MSCEQLVCAVCAGPVAEARCPTCRLAKAQVHEHRVALSPQLLGLLLILAGLLSAVLLHLRG